MLLRYFRVEEYTDEVRVINQPVEKPLIPGIT